MEIDLLLPLFPSTVKPTSTLPSPTALPHSVPHIVRRFTRPVLAVPNCGMSSTILTFACPHILRHGSLRTEPLRTAPSPLSMRPRSRQRTSIRLALSPPNDETRVRFDRGSEDPASRPKRSFFPSDPSSGKPSTPNDRVLEQVRSSMRRLGVEDNLEPPAPRPFKPIDISRVNPLSAFAGAAGAAGISYASWTGLVLIVNFFVSHPLTNDLYIVQRLSAVVRTVLVCLFALGSGIAGVTGLGLFLLGVRTSAAAATGEFREKE